MIRYTLVILLLSFLYPHCADSAGERYAVALGPVPVFNSPSFSDIFGGSTGNHLKTDRFRQIRELEFIALQGTIFSVHGELPSASSTVYSVTTDDYPYAASGGYYLDSRFVKVIETPPPKRNRELPDIAEIISRLRSAAGSRYIWGGNVGSGVPEMMAYFPANPGKQLSEDTRIHWILKGYDCSGLLYAATNGRTPRNTSSLVHFGKPVPVAGKDLNAIAGILRPLDLIVWPGHVLIVIDNKQIIESRLACGQDDDGVKIFPLEQRLREILRQRVPADGLSNRKDDADRLFVVRRWIEA